jgi:hypothetical protein
VEGVRTWPSSHDKHTKVQSLITSTSVLAVTVFRSSVCTYVRIFAYNFRFSHLVLLMTHLEVTY